MKRTTKRGVAVGLVAVVALASAGAIVASQLGDSPPPDLAALDKAIQSEPMTRVADIPSADGLAERGVFVQVTSTGEVCLWDAPSAQARGRMGGCNDASDLLGGSKISASLAYDGGPATADVRDARMIGLVDPAVAMVRVLMSDGSYRTVKLLGSKIQGRSYGAFGYRFRRSDLAKGIGPVAVVATDASGTEIGRQPTGFGG
ncbi:MAG TPA: hypothetical protein VFK76_02230 [Gaiellaceae bacterium]|nr:hypothetical protein [Gaiellaceae bacterium]